MYSEEQRHDHIRELQRFLHDLSYYNRRIPRIIPDGVYSTETEGAVRIFQREYGLPSTGKVDFATWEKAAELNRIFYPDIVKPDVFGKDTVIIPGSAGPAVYIIQVMLDTIGKNYGNIPADAITGIYDAATERAVDAYKRISGMSTGKEGINPELWNNIVSNFNRNVLR